MRGHLVADVEHLGDDARLLVVAELVVVRELEPDPRTVDVAVAQSRSPLGSGAREHVHPALDRPVVVVGMDELERPVPENLVARPTEHLGRGLVDVEEDRGLVLALHAHAGATSSKSAPLPISALPSGISTPISTSCCAREVEEVEQRVVAAREVHLRLRGTGGPHAIPRVDHESLLIGFDEIERRPRAQ